MDVCIQPLMILLVSLRLFTSIKNISSSFGLYMIRSVLGLKFIPFLTYISTPPLVDSVGVPTGVC